MNEVQNPNSGQEGREEEVERLKEGIHSFRQSHFHRLEGLFQKLAESQNPDALFITCSDSRIDPNLLTQSLPGDLFILRNAGNIVPPYGVGSGGEAATIDFAVAVLGVRNVVVCGHSSCGAMKALLDPAPVQHLPALAAWLDRAEATRQIVRDNYGDLSGERLLSVTIEENVLVQLDNLRTFPSVASRLARGDLSLHGWVYRFETGEVFAFDPAAGQFVPIAEYRSQAGAFGRRSTPII